MSGQDARPPDQQQQQQDKEPVVLWRSWALTKAAVATFVSRAAAESLRGFVQAPFCSLEERPDLCHQQTELNRFLVERCPALQSFSAAPWAPGPISQTVLGLALNSGSKRYQRRELVQVADGVELLLDWKEPEHDEQPLPDSAPVLLLLHGIGGGSESRLSCKLSDVAKCHGWRCVVFNRRGHGQSSVLPGPLAPLTPFGTLPPSSGQPRIGMLGGLAPSLPFLRSKTLKTLVSTSSSWAPAAPSARPAPADAALARTFPDTGQGPDQADEEPEESEEAGLVLEGQAPPEQKSLLSPDRKAPQGASGSAASMCTAPAGSAAAAPADIPGGQPAASAATAVPVGNLAAIASTGTGDSWYTGTYRASHKRCRSGPPPSTAASGMAGVRSAGAAGGGEKGPAVSSSGDPRAHEATLATQVPGEAEAAASQLARGGARPAAHGGPAEGGGEEGCSAPAAAVAVPHSGASLLKQVSRIFPRHADTDDLAAVVEFLQAEYPDAPLVALGFSQGSNVLTQYIGQECSRGKRPFVGAVSVSNAYDLCLGTRQLAGDWTTDAVITQPLKQLLQKELVAVRQLAHVHGLQLDLRRAVNALSIREFDEALLVRAFGFNSLEDFYAAQSSHTALQDIALPMLLLNNLDDPIIRDRLPLLADEAARTNPWLIAARTQRGGHLGWLQGWKGHAWLADIMMQFAKAAVEAAERGVPAAPVQ